MLNGFVSLGFTICDDYLTISTVWLSNLHYFSSVSASPTSFSNLVSF